MEIELARSFACFRPTEECSAKGSAQQRYKTFPYHSLLVARKSKAILAEMRSCHPDLNFVATVDNTQS
jgi:hypothetical protein